LWSAESGGADAFTPLALAAAWTPTLRLGTAIIPVYTRGPHTLASQVASLCSAAPGRFAVGIGASSNVIVERWNNIAFEKPYQRVRDTIRFLRAALRGEKVDEEYETFRVRGFRLLIKVPEQPPILVAALRPGMLRLAGREGDGAIINWLSANDVRTVVPHVGEGKEIVARLFVLPTEDRDVVRMVGSRAIAQYLNVPVYAAFHEWLGRGEMLKGMWAHWKAGDRDKATASIPDELIDDLIIWGSPEQIRDHVDRYVANGVTTPAPAILAPPDQARATMRALAPANR
jgi:probable F420-dependent oxidoreductase